MLIIVLFLAATGVGIIAGMMTYFIHYNEYQHHFHEKRAHRESFQSAVVSFIFFFALTLIIAFILYYLFK